MRETIRIAITIARNGYRSLHPKVVRHEVFVRNDRVIVAEVVRKKGEAADRCRSGGGRQAGEHRVVVLGIGFDVESREAQRGTAYEDGGDGPNRVVMEAGELRAHLHEQDSGRDSERH